MIDQRLIDDFERDGFLVLRRAIAKRQQHDLLSVVRQMISSRCHAARITDKIGLPPSDLYEFFDNYVLAVDKADHEIVRLVFESCFDTIAGRAIFATPLIEFWASELLKCDPRHLFLNSNRLRIDPPGPAPYRLGWHQESAYGRSKSPAVQYWAPLLWPSGWDNGSVELAVGSHKLGHYENIFSERREIGAQQFLVPDEVVARFPTIILEIEPGDVALFSCDLVHRSSSPERQKRMKYSVIGRLTDAVSPLFSPYGR